MAKQRIKRIDHIEKELHRDHFFIGYFNHDFPVQDKPQRHDYHQLFWFTQGNGTHFTDGQAFDIIPGDLFLVAEEQEHYFGQTKDLSGYLLCFKENYVPESFFDNIDYKATLFNHLLIHPLFRLSQDQSAELEIVIRGLLAEYHKKNAPYKREVVLSYLRILFIFLERIKAAAYDKAQKGSNDYQLFLRFVNQLESDFNEKHDVAAYAEALQVTARKLSSVSQRYNGRNAKELIEIRIIAEARRLLQSSALSVKEVAFQTGFTDQYQFSKFFKKQTGIAPLRYKQLNKG